MSASGQAVAPRSTSSRASAPSRCPSRRSLCAVTLCRWCVRGPSSPLLVVDGLGHGVAAQQAAKAACEVFQKSLVTSPSWRFSGSMRPARNPRRRHRRRQRRSRSPPPSPSAARKHRRPCRRGRPGQALRLHERHRGPHRWTAQGVRLSVRRSGLVVILHSDGIGTSWSLDRYPGLAARHPALIAAILYRDGTRGRDDATVLVLRRSP